MSARACRNVRDVLRRAQRKAGRAVFMSARVCRNAWDVLRRAQRKAGTYCVHECARLSERAGRAKARTTKSGARCVCECAPLSERVGRVKARTTKSGARCVYECAPPPSAKACAAYLSFLNLYSAPKSSTVAFFMRWSLTGRSFLAVFVLAISSTVSIPSMTLPNAA